MSGVLKQHHVKQQTYKFSSLSLNNIQQIRKRKHIIKNSSAFVLGCLRLYQVRFQLQIYQAVIIIIIIIIIIIMSYRSFLALKIRNEPKYF
jgi:membrane-associated HD superfamily phosphohydrolase